MKKFFKKTKKGFSLIEILVSMSIFGIILIMLNQVLLSSLQISQENYVRGAYREATTELFDFIQRDIRNGNIVEGFSDDTSACDNTNQEENVFKCLLIENDQNNTVMWRTCDGDEDSICRYKVNPSNNNQPDANAPNNGLKKKSSSSIYVKDIRFEMVPDITVDAKEGFQNSVVAVTIESAPIAGESEVELVEDGEILIDIQQIIVTTRNATKG